MPRGRRKKGAGHLAATTDEKGGPVPEASPARGPARITVVGLGPAGPELLTAAAEAELATATVAYLRTGRHPAAAGVGAVETFDDFYDTSATFDEVYRRIVDQLVAAAERAATTGGHVVYGVPGSPLVAERTVELLRADPRVSVTVIPALSFLDLAWDRLGVDPLAESVRLIDGTRFATQAADQRGPLLVAQCWSNRVLSDIKLSIDTDLVATPAPVTVLHHLGLPDERVERIRWDELDRVGAPDHLTSLYIPQLAVTVGSDLVALEQLVRTLRAQCPWDREQTHASLTRHLLEEAYEVIDAINALTEAELRATENGTPVGAHAVPTLEAEAVAHLQEELGDLLFQVYFHACVAAEEGRFTLADVAQGIHEKLVARHPHVFGDVVATDAQAVLAGWERSKMAEKGRDSVTDGIPTVLPALALAATLQRKALAVHGLDLPDFEQQRQRLLSALARLAAPSGGTSPPGEDAAVRQVGELLWGLSDLGGRLGVDPEDSLRAAALRFRDQVRHAEHG